MFFYLVGVSSVICWVYGKLAHFFSYYGSGQVCFPCQWKLCSQCGRLPICACLSKLDSRLYVRVILNEEQFKLSLAKLAEMGSFEQKWAKVQVWESGLPRCFREASARLPRKSANTFGLALEAKTLVLLVPKRNGSAWRHSLGFAVNLSIQLWNWSGTTPFQLQLGRGRQLFLCIYIYNISIYRYM